MSPKSTKHTYFEPRSARNVNLKISGFLGFLVSGLALAAVLFQYRHFLLPLLLFLLFTTIFDSISVIASLTSTEDWDEPAQYLTTAWNYFPTFSSGLAVSVMACKIFFSIFLLERVIHNYKKNIKIRGGRSPVRRNYSASPGKNLPDQNQQTLHV